MKKVILIVTVLFCLVHKGAVAQTAAGFLTKFTDSFSFGVQYPGELSDSCICTATMLKITVDNKMAVSDMLLSKSAHPLYVKHFLANQSRVDKASLNQYLKIKKIKNAVLLMPMYISVTSNACTTKPISINELRNLTGFERNDFTGHVILLPPYNAPIVVEVVQ